MAESSASAAAGVVAVDELELVRRGQVEALNLPADVLTVYRRKFDALDLNRDGVVEVREFAAVSRVFGYNLSREEILEIFDRQDFEDSGGITFDEFVLAMRKRAGHAQASGDIRTKFRQYDKKKTGYINADDAFPILERELGFDLSKTEAMVDLYDRNKDYRLSIIEFIDFQKKVEALKQQIVEAFNEFDGNQDGYVDLEEVCAKMVPRGCTPEQVEALFRKADKNGDGRLDYSEFAAFWDIPID